MVFENDPKEPDIARMLTVTIEGRPPTLNARRHWREVAADNAMWKETARLVGIDAITRFHRRHGLKWRTLDRAALSVTFTIPDRRRHDFDNLVSALKPLLDGLVAAGVVADDSTDHIVDLNVSTRYEKGRTAVVLHFDEVVDPEALDDRSIP